VTAPDSGLVVGLTGGIGSGKSTVADLFAGLGAAVVDADAIAHELTAPGGAAMARIVEAFGDAALTAEGALNRAAMRSRAFADPAVRAQLEGILHPLILTEAERRTRAALVAGAPYVVLVVPLLIESGSYRERVDRVAVVDCSEAVQIERVCSRSGLPVEAVKAIMAAQASRAERLAAADDVIDNQGDPGELREAVAKLDTDYRSLALKMGGRPRKIL
jgi:dephospho-CoA kinase